MAVSELMYVVEVVRMIVFVPKVNKNLPAPDGAPLGILKPG